MKRIGFILIIALLNSTLLFANIAKDTIAVESKHEAPQQLDSIFSTKESNKVVVDTVKQWRPDSQKGIWLGVIIPGAGQFYNRQYWKLPIVYGAFFGCAYAITWNGRMYTDYKQAYVDITTTTDYTNPDASFIKILPKGYTIESMGGVANYTSILENRQNQYRRNRDLGIIVTVAVYALSLIDAFVDAQLYDFDISPDVSFNVEPQIYNDINNQRSAELHLSFNF